MARKRFSEGGEVLDGPNPNIDDDTRSRAMESVAQTPAAPEYKSFKDAFAANRKAGAKSFEYKGKKYTTEMAAARKEAPAPRARAASESPERRDALRSQPVYRGAAPSDSASDKSRLAQIELPKFASGGQVKARASVKNMGKAYK